MKKGPLLASIILSIALIGGAVVFAGGEPVSQVEENNVSMEGAIQIIRIGAKGGYSPRETLAKAGVPTVIRVTTNGTYDCSSALNIPAIGYSKILEATSVTDIEIPTQSSGSSIQGLCSMGMYNFSVKFM